jgi:hypothetical protein
MKALIKRIKPTQYEHDLSDQPLETIQPDFISGIPDSEFSIETYLSKTLFDNETKMDESNISETYDIPNTYYRVSAGILFQILLSATDTRNKFRNERSKRYQKYKKKRGKLACKKCGAFKKGNEQSLKAWFFTHLDFHHPCYIKKKYVCSVCASVFTTFRHCAHHMNTFHLGLPPIVYNNRTEEDYEVLLKLLNECFPS